jgi:long-subunit acyl-CoA synthetase (AMP-forming)
MIFTTSGTTGVRKVFELTDAQLEARAASRGTSKGSAMAGVRVLFCALPLTSTAGHSWMMWAAANNIVFSTPADGENAFERAGIEGIVASPATLRHYALIGRRRSFRAVMASGTSVSPRAAGMIMRGLGSNLFVSYGASEVGSIAVGSGDMAERVPGCVGPLCPGVEARFDDHGQIMVKTETMISGYTDPTVTEQYFQDGWFLTGDTGHMTKGGMLVLRGRMRVHQHRHPHA